MTSISPTISPTPTNGHHWLLGVLTTDILQPLMLLLLVVVVVLVLVVVVVVEILLYPVVHR